MLRFASHLLAIGVYFHIPDSYYILSPISPAAMYLNGGQFLDAIALS